MNYRSALIASVFCLTPMMGLMAGQGAMAQSYTEYNQDVRVEQLGSAQAYDVGTLSDDNEFGPTLWSGTSVKVAIAIIEAAPTRSRSVATTDLVARTLLSGGAPPQGAGSNPGDAYMAARLGALVKMGRGGSVEQILGRQPQQAGTVAGQQLNADKALLAGDNKAACLVADNISEARSQPYWAKLRAFCHVVRGEIPAAELTADLLERTGHSAPHFYAALARATGLKIDDPVVTNHEPLLVAMARFSGASLPPPAADSGDATLSNLLKDALKLTPSELGQRLSVLTLMSQNGDDESPVGGYFDLDETMRRADASSWGQLYGVVTTSTDMGTSAKAAGELLRRADAKGLLAPFAALLGDSLAIIPAHLRAQGHIPTFAKLAVAENDLGALRGLYEALPANDRGKMRLALASDALGNGFMMGALGQDMTRELAGNGPNGGAGRSRAVRDAFIAVSLGAQLSEDSALSLADYNGHLTGRAAAPGALLALKAASERGARAETALRAASILGEGGPQNLRADSLGSVLSALQAAGLQELAGRLAAEDFLAGK